MIPSQFIFALPAGTASTLATSQNATNSIVLNVTTVLSSAAYVQRRVIIFSLGADSGLAFNLSGLNAAGMKISELLPAVSTGNATSALDYASLISPITVQNLTSGIGTATSSSITVGVSPNGASLWQSVNNMITPMNLALSGVPVPAAGTSVTNSAVWMMQYTYDDPNWTPFSPARFSLGAYRSIRGLGQFARQVYKPALTNHKKDPRRGRGQVLAQEHGRMYRF
jgi:hypothetical protein